MSNHITGGDLIARGWESGPAIGLALRAATALEETSREDTLSTLDAVRADPQSFLSDPVLGALARQLIARAPVVVAGPPLREAPIPYRTWGREGIEESALAQMDAAMRLPITVAGALMPDAHLGYGLPIGGVLATEGCVIPYAVGVDIACRMRLSVYPIHPSTLNADRERYRQALLQNTHFGAGVESPKGTYHEVLDDPAWRETRLLRDIHALAGKQIGTSGTGNHFVEWGRMVVTEKDNTLGLDPGEYLALLSHSGSRAVGFKIANAYSKIATEFHPTLDESVKHLAWLPLDREAGEEYWLSMELAGRFASANHFVIHQRVAAAAGLEEVAHVENHHNFAWRETHDGQESIVHRKGATPAAANVLGIIPGSMGDPGFVVRGKGNPESLDSASHGAGRRMSRRQALKNITEQDRLDYLTPQGIELLGGGLDESPQAYKRIEQVIAAQEDLIDIVGEFHPRMVRMASEAGDI
jgi:tRNA-splicing ligase RtcB